MKKPFIVFLVLLVVVGVIFGLYMYQKQERPVPPKVSWETKQVIYSVLNDKLEGALKNQKVDGLILEVISILEEEGKLSEEEMVYARDFFEEELERFIFLKPKTDALINRRYPPSPIQVLMLSGVIRNVGYPKEITREIKFIEEIEEGEEIRTVETLGIIVEIKIANPNDFLPNQDGTPRNTQVRFIQVFDDTAVSLVDYTNLLEDGTPSSFLSHLSQLRIGDGIKVFSEQDIRDAEEFEPSRLEIIRY